MKQSNDQTKEPIGIPQPEKLPVIVPPHEPTFPTTYPAENPIENPQKEPIENPPYVFPKPSEFP